MGNTPRYITLDNFLAQKTNFKNGVMVFTSSTFVWGNQVDISHLSSFHVFFLFFTGLFPIFNSL